MAPPKKRLRNAAIVAAYHRGETPAAIAARQDPPISADRVRQILRDAAVPIARWHRGPGRAPIPVVAPDGAALGATLAEAAKAVGCSVGALRGAGHVRDGTLYLHRQPRGRETDQKRGA